MGYKTVPELAHGIEIDSTQLNQTEPDMRERSQITEQIRWREEAK